MYYSCVFRIIFTFIYLLLFKICLGKIYQNNFFATLIINIFMHFS